MNFQNSHLAHELVDANQILTHLGVLDGFGHVSVRHESDHNLFLISRSMAPALVTVDDLVLCDLGGNVIDPKGRKSYVERFIHSSIYSARPDVHAVIHSHSPALIPFGVTGARLRPICHMSGFLGHQGVPIFEIRDAMEESSDMLIRNVSLGDALAISLGRSSVALMRGHGSVAVGASLKQAVFRAFYTEKNACLQMQAQHLGNINFLNEDEAKLSASANDEHLNRPWELWLKAVKDLK
jgi:ribulose-5-phosphate 4-epimerase/fuculose-1-phosphate aldolase